jgi:hypothetical protein
VDVQSALGAGDVRRINTRYTGRTGLTAASRTRRTKGPNVARIRSPVIDFGIERLIGFQTHSGSSWNANSANQRQIQSRVWNCPTNDRREVANRTRGGGRLKAVAGNLGFRIISSKSVTGRTGSRNDVC